MRASSRASTISAKSWSIVSNPATSTEGRASKCLLQRPTELYVGTGDLLLFASRSQHRSRKMGARGPNFAPVIDKLRLLLDEDLEWLPEVEVVRLVELMAEQAVQLESDLTTRDAAALRFAAHSLMNA